MNIPARYCTGYLSDIGTPAPYSAGDFAGWFEAYLSGRWYTFDPRNNARRAGRVLMAQGCDAADVPISNTFGMNILNRNLSGEVTDDTGLGLLRIPTPEETWRGQRSGAFGCRRGC
jgi:transglutaminase-like putative cysteine protease